MQAHFANLNDQTHRPKFAEWYWLPGWMIQRPGIIYGLMVIAFYFGTIVFVIYAGIVMDKVVDFAVP